MPNFKNRPFNRHIFKANAADSVAADVEIWATPEKIDVKNVFLPRDLPQNEQNTEGVSPLAF